MLLKKEWIKNLFLEITIARYEQYKWNCMCGSTQRLHEILWCDMEGLKTGGNLRYLIFNADSS